MYKKILLAYDGTVEGRTALREGALMAKRMGAEVFLLSVVAESSGVMLAEGAYAGAINSARPTYQSVLEEGVLRLRVLGLNPDAKLVTGDPPAAICAYAREIGADLLVVGHRRQNMLQRWWSGSVNASLLDLVNCSILISRNTISDEVVLAELNRPDR